MPINAKTKLGGGGLPKLAAQSAPNSAYGQISVSIPLNSTDLLAVDASGRFLFSGARFFDMEAGSSNGYIIRRVQIDGVDIFTNAGSSRSSFGMNRDSSADKGIHINGQFLVESNIKIWVNSPVSGASNLIVGLYAIE